MPLKESEKKAFKTASGKNYREVDQLNLTEIKQYFEKQDYAVLEIKQPWRHAVGILEKDSKKYFLKIAAGEGVSERTENEADFNQKLAKIIKENKIDYFDVPKIFKTGHYKKYYYFIASYHKPDLLATKKPLDSKNLEKWLPKIIKLNNFLFNLPNLNLSQDASRAKNKSAIVQNYLEKYQIFYQDVKNKNLELILKEANKIQDYYEPSLNHGDFTPWHMMQEGDKIILFDNESASNLTPKYYDVAYCYQRIYTGLKNPDLANDYLETFQKQLSTKERSTFKPLFKALLASRILGGFYDAFLEGGNEYEIHEQLRNDFESGEII